MFCFESTLNGAGYRTLRVIPTEGGARHEVLEKDDDWRMLDERSNPVPSSQNGSASTLTYTLVTILEAARITHRKRTHLGVCQWSQTRVAGTHPNRESKHREQCIDEDRDRAGCGGGRYPRFGRYLLEVEVIRTKESFKGDSAIAELKVRESKPLPGGEDPSRPGETVDYVENLSDQKKGGGGRFKSFLTTLVGADELEFANPVALKKFFDERQAGTHLLIRCEVYPKQLPPKDGQPGKVISGYRWTHLELNDEQVEQARKASKLPPLADALK